MSATHIDIDTNSEGLAISALDLRGGPEIDIASTVKLDASSGGDDGSRVAAPPVRRFRFLRFVLRLVWKLVSLVALVGGLGLSALVAAPAVTDHETLIIKSGSMGDAAPVGSAVVAKPLAPKDVEVGDIILLARERDGRVLTPVLHRVIERWDEGGQVMVRTKGDANPQPDIEPYIIKGTTLTPVAVLPRIGFAIAFLRTPLGWFGLIIGPAMLTTAISIYRIWDTDEDEDDTDEDNDSDGDDQADEPEADLIDLVAEAEADIVEPTPDSPTLWIDPTAPAYEHATRLPPGRHRRRPVGRHLSIRQAPVRAGQHLRRR